MTPRASQEGTPTPRTDAAILVSGTDRFHTVPASFARTLELENLSLQRRLGEAEGREKRLREVLLVLVNAVENYEDIESEDYDPALAHNFNATFGAVMESLKQARATLNQGDKGL